MKQAYNNWLERTALEFLENRDQNLEYFLDRLKSNFVQHFIAEMGISKVLSDLTRKIDELR